MTLPVTLEQAVSLELSQYLGKPVVLYAPSALGGGSINHALRLRSSAGDFFLKWNDAHLYPGMFEAEARGLGLLTASNKIKIPKVIASGKTGTYTWLLLEFISSGKERQDFWEDFGQSLASLHSQTSRSFGLDHDNYIGSLSQSNKQHPGWSDFFIEERLQIQSRLARDAGLLDSTTSRKLEHLYKRMDDIFPQEPPSLIHGDLWSGNFMVGDDGHVCLIDPAVYYGHREMDIAMTKLFGGFHFNFYGAYTKSRPLEAGWQSRVDICNLYPLMVHLNLFGKGYLGSIERTLEKF